MKREKRIGKIIEILNQTHKSGGISVKELAQQLQITERTVYSDLNIIESELALPLQRPQNRSKNSEGKYLLAVEDNDWELVPLYSLVLEKKLGPGNLIKNTMSFEFRDLKDKLKIKDFELVKISESKDKLKIFLQALIENREIDLTYTTFNRGNEVTRRVVRPFGLVWYCANWYVVGYCLLREAIRTFKLDRVIKVKVLETNFTRPEDFDLDDYFTYSWGVVAEADALPKEVKLLFSSQVANEVIKYRYHPSQRIRWVDNGWLEVTFTISSVSEMKNWLLGWGRDVIVVEPEELRQELVQLLKDCLQNLGVTV